MRNKKLLYILILATVIIWGAVAYKIFLHLKHNNDFTETRYLPHLESDSVGHLNSYTLLANYRDPFRAGRRAMPANRKVTVEKPVRQTNSNPRYERRNQQRIYWPSVIYNGVIMNEQKQVALIQIDTKKFLMTEGEERDRIRLLRLFPDSVRVEFEGETKTIVKK